MAKKDHHVHDKFIKKVLSNKKTAKQYLQKFVRPHILKWIDFRTFKLSPTSYVDDKLKEFVSDLVYECECRNGTAGSPKIRISFLFEHKSYLPKYPHIQLLRYILEALERDALESKKLNLTIPIVFYHGKKRWNHKAFHEYFDLPDKDLQAFIPNFDYLLTNISAMTDEQIMAVNVDFLVNAFLVLKHSRDKEYVMENSDKILINGVKYYKTEEGKLFIEILQFYIYRTIDFSEKELNLFMEIIPRNLKESFMSAYEMLIKKGKEEGIEIGKEEGIEIGMEKIVQKLILNNPEKSDIQLAELVGIPIALVKKVRKSL